MPDGLRADMRSELEAILAELLRDDCKGLLQFYHVFLRGEAKYFYSYRCAQGAGLGKTFVFTIRNIGKHTWFAPFCVSTSGKQKFAPPPFLKL